MAAAPARSATPPGVRRRLPGRHIPAVFARPLLALLAPLDTKSLCASCPAPCAPYLVPRTLQTKLNDFFIYFLDFLNPSSMARCCAHAWWEWARRLLGRLRLFRDAAPMRGGKGSARGGLAPSPLQQRLIDVWEVKSTCDSSNQRLLREIDVWNVKSTFGSST